MKKFILSKLRTKSFWVAVAGAIALILSALGFTDGTALSYAGKAVGGIMLLLGITFSPPKENKPSDELQDEESDTTDKDTQNTKLK